MEPKEISKAVIKRLPRYYRYLGELMEENVERISSNDLSKKMHVTASQIRQDLNNFGGFGQQGYGYNVRYLYTEIGKILGLDTVHPMIILGVGNLGQALANYVDFVTFNTLLIVLPELSTIISPLLLKFFKYSTVLFGTSLLLFKSVPSKSETYNIFILSYKICISFHILRNINSCFFTSFNTF